MTQKTTYTDAPVDMRNATIEDGFWRYVFGDAMIAQPPTLEQVAFSEDPNLRRLRDIGTAIKSDWRDIAYWVALFFWAYKLFFAFPCAIAGYTFAALTRTPRRLLVVLTILATMHYANEWAM